MNRQVSIVLCSAALIGFAACSKEPATPDSDGHDHGAGDGHDDGHADHGPVIELGTSAIGDWTVSATRDEGEIEPGGDAPIDVRLTGGSSKVVAVRFWIGAEDASGSIKARAEIEDPAEPDHWHTHAEAPDPIPSGSRLWVELELEGQGKKTGSFDLKM